MSNHEEKRQNNPADRARAKQNEMANKTQMPNQAGKSTTTHEPENRGKAHEATTEHAQARPQHNIDR
jgi:hypothetical protein